MSDRTPTLQNRRNVRRNQKVTRAIADRAFEQLVRELQTAN